MRTTVDIPDPKYRMLKSRAALEGTTVKELVMRGVDVVLEVRPPRRSLRLKLPLIQAGELNSLRLDNEKIYDLIGFP